MITKILSSGLTGNDNPGWGFFIYLTFELFQWDSLSARATTLNHESENQVS